MKVLLVLGHPAHVHFFRNVIKALEKEGEEVFVFAQDREETAKLLEYYGIEYGKLNVVRKSLFYKAWGLIENNLKILREIRKIKPDLFIGKEGCGIYASQTAWLSRKPSILVTDTENAGLIHKLSTPFASKILTPECFEKDFGLKHVRFNGYCELAYLHPKYFKPNPKVLEYEGLREGEKYVLVRISNWDASHDLKTRGFRDEKEVEEFIEKIDCDSILISSEIPLSGSLKELQVRTPAEWMHHLIYYSTAYVGEGATMASEAGILGVPWVWISRGQSRGYLREQMEKHKTGFIVDTPEQALEKLAEILHSNSREQWRVNASRMVSEKCDVTSWLVDYVKKEYG